MHLRDNLQKSTPLPTVIPLGNNDRNQADRLADRVQIMKEGRIEETGEGI